MACRLDATPPVDDLRWLEARSDAPPTDAMQSKETDMERPEIEAAFRETSHGIPDGVELGARLAECLRTARAKWPRAQVADLVFARCLGKAAGEGGGTLDGVETDDLYLASGCVEGDPASVAHLADLVRRGASKWASGVDVDVDDLGQRVLSRLLLPEGGAEARLARYEGRAPLVAYLKTVTRHLAVSLVRNAERHEAMPAPSTFFAAIGNPEQDAIRVEFGEAFSRALDDAFCSLESRQRAVIAMHYADGVEVDAIAQVYRVHRVTVSRWLADARTQVFEKARQHLRGALGLTESDFENALRIIRSQIEISLSTLGGVARDASTGDGAMLEPAMLEPAMFEPADGSNKRTAT